jgi:hypothetical protein
MHAKRTPTLVMPANTLKGTSAGIQSYFWIPGRSPE